MILKKNILRKIELSKQISILEKENKRLLDNQDRLESLLDEIGIINCGDIYNFIFELYNFKNEHICVFHPDDVEQDLYDTVYNQIKDEIREDLLNELNPYNQDVEDYISKYNLSVYNKTKQINIPYFEQIKNQCKYNKYTPIFVNKDPIKYIKEDNIKKITLKQNIINNTIFYPFKLIINNIPIIVEHYKYEYYNFKQKEIVPYFNINNYFKNLLSLFNKYNISFKKDKKVNVNKIVKQDKNIILSLDNHLYL